MRGSFHKPDDQAAEVKTLDFRRPPSAAGLGSIPWNPSQTFTKKAAVNTHTSVLEQ